MTRAIVTFAVGAEHEQLLEIALPSFQAFADLHGHELIVGVPMMPMPGPPRPPSWWKIPALTSALERHDEALWLDADTIIVDPTDDIPVPEYAWQVMVEHYTPDGHVPNLGVWLVRRPMLPALERMWGMIQYLHHGWWEQAAMLELLGYRADPRPARLIAGTPLFDRTEFLDAGWNVHPWDVNRAGRERILHATMHPDRASVMRGWARDANLMGVAEC
jgi:hypothetical protein